jgi:uncharacterized membrane protein YhhN
MLGVALALGVVDWVAVARGRRRVEYVFKPATLVAIIVAALLMMSGPHDARLGRFFLLGLAFSLAGDVFLMLPGERFFLPGLVAFLVAHVFYVVGLTPTWPPVASLPVVVVVAALGVTLYRRVAAALRRQDHRSMLVPTAVYAVVLSLMLFSAWATLVRPAWSWPGRAVVIVGATLFFASDAMLAWNKFVAPSHRLHVAVIVTYHLAQIALAAVILLGPLR